MKRKPRWLFDGESEFWYALGMVGATLLAMVLIVLTIMLGIHC